MMQEEVQIRLTEINAFAGNFLDTLVPKTEATVLALSGDLGAGKTTLVQALAKKLGVTEQVTSPTFTIMSKYETADSRFDQLIHMDAYRIEDEGELGPLHFGALLKQPNTLFCIEWAERISTALPKSVITIKLQVGDDENTRIAHISR